jgi:hypothetical protein
MNSERNLLKRLLKSYPVKVLKDVFDITGLSQNEVIEQILNSNAPPIIKNFAFNNFSYLRQHVYIYDINGVMPNNWVCENALFHSENLISNNERDINLIFTATYQVYSIGNAGLTDVLFYTPVKIKVYNNKMIVSINIQERDVTNLFPNKCFLANKNMSDDEIILHIIQNMPLTAHLAKTDINRGIKQLWEEDFVDAAYVKFKKSRSTSTEVMDENFTLKVNMPSEYNRLLNEPLQKNVFKILAVDNIISHFTTEPSVGKLSFTKFPENINSIPSLILLILSKN